MLEKINPFAKNVLKLGGATLFSQMVSFLILPFLSRLYSPDDFGSFGFFLAISTFLAVIAGFKYENAIVMSKDDIESGSLYVLSFGSTILVTIVSFLVFVLFGETIITKLGYDESAFPFYLVSLYVFVFGLTQLNKQYFNYKSQFSTISINQIIGRTSSIIPKVVFGVLKLGGIGLIIGELLNLITQITYSVNKVKINWKRLGLKELRSTAKKYNRFPMYELPMDFINTAAQKIPVVLMASYFGLGFVGLYVFSNTIPRQIITLTSQNIGGVYYRKIANQTIDYQKEKTQKLLQKLFLVGVFPFTVLTFFSQSFYEIIFSDKWIEAGLYVQILSPSFFILFLIKPINSALFRVLNKQNIELYLNVLYAVLTIVVVLIAGILENNVLAILGISLTGFFVWGIMLSYLLKIIKINFYSTLKNFLKYFLYSFMSILIPLYVQFFLDIKFVFLFVALVLSTAIYLCTLYLFDKKSIINYLK